MGKIAYRIQNWSEYNRALINRGNLTLWFSEDAIQSWYSQEVQEGRGRRFTYKVPHYSILSRRSGGLSIAITRKEKSGALDLVIDSTGLKVYGEGEWKMRTHGKQKRRTWRKYHVAVDPETHEVVAMELTEVKVHDADAVADLLKGLKSLGNVYGDGAYPLRQSLDAIAAAGGHAIIPPRAGTCIVKKDPSPGQEQRNRLIRERRAVGGKKAWKKSSGYHRRSLVETHMFRLKTILGGEMHSINISNQKSEAAIMASILNKMTALGMPKTQSFVK